MKAKRIVSILLTGSMLLSLLPVSALAAAPVFDAPAQTTRGRGGKLYLRRHPPRTGERKRGLRAHLPAHGCQDAAVLQPLPRRRRARGGPGRCPRGAKARATRRLARPVPSSGQTPARCSPPRRVRPAPRPPGTQCELRCKIVHYLFITICASMVCLIINTRIKIIF